LASYFSIFFKFKTIGRTYHTKIRISLSKQKYSG
jgi:hypothetical protein